MMENKDLNIVRENIDNLKNYVSWIRWFPDLFIDSITPESGTIRLDADQRLLMRAIARYINVYGVFPRGWSKCVVGDTRIFTDRGLVKIGDFFDNKKDNKESYKNLDIRVKNKDGYYSKANKGVYSGYKKTVKIKTIDGHEIEGSLNHPLMVIDESGMMDFKPMGQIAETDFLAISLKNNAFPKTKGRIKGLLVTKEILMASAYFLRYAQYDVKKCSYYIQGHPKKKDFDEIKRYLKVKFDLVIKYDKEHSRWWLDDDFFDNIFVKTTKCGDKCKAIPEYLFSCDKLQVVAFLRYFIKYSMSLSHTAMRISVDSDEIGRDIQLIFLNLGIYSRLVYSNVGWIVVISGIDFPKYGKIIGFLEDDVRKKEGYKDRINIMERTFDYTIPYQHKMVKTFYDQVKPNFYKYYNNFKHYYERNSDIPMNKIKLLLDLSKNINTKEKVHFQNIYDAKYVFVGIKEMTYENNHVYDIQVPVTNSFIGNGFVNHNTFIEVLTGYVTCVAYPNMEMAISAQTKDNASKLLWDKHQEIVRFYPFFENEISSWKNSKDETVIYFKSGSKFDTLANAQSTKGSRRRRLVIEESALLNAELFDDVLKPVVNIGRITAGKKSLVDPRELNGSIDFFTTSGEFLRPLYL